MGVRKDKRVSVCVCLDADLLELDRLLSFFITTILPVLWWWLVGGGDEMVLLFDFLNERQQGYRLNDGFGHRLRFDVFFIYIYEL